MSAAESLKRLWDNWDLADDGQIARESTEVWAEIIAMVEAAEGIEGELPRDQGCHDMIYCVEFRVALSALNEKLGNGERG